MPADAGYRTRCDASPFAAVPAPPAPRADRCAASTPRRRSWDISRARVSLPPANLNAAADQERSPSHMPADKPTYEIIVKGNNLRLADGYLGMTNLTLIKTNDGYMLVDVGHTVNRQGLLRGLKERGL